MVCVLDHYYAMDHFEFCRVIRTDMDDEQEVAELLSAIQFYFEDHVSESANPDLDGVVRLLVNHFDFKVVDKDSWGNQLWEIMNYMADVDYQNFEPFDFDDGPCVYIDLYESRESFCGGNQPDKLCRKWLTDEVCEEIIMLPRE